MHPQSTALCPCGCNLPLPPGARFRRGHHWKALLGERFWAKVNKNGPIIRPELGPCWLWNGAIRPNGYGAAAVDRRDVNAHALAYQLTYGEVATGLSICHHCDNRPCVRPDHLYAGTPRQNTQDAIRRGRMNVEAFAHNQFHVRGEQSPNAVLTESDVLAIRLALANKTATGLALAEQYGVAASTISAIKKRKLWSHL